jgi:large subunit ribosomal protein L6
MSRYAKQPIVIPDKVSVEKHGDIVVVKGPLGELSRTFRSEVDISIDDKEINLKPLEESTFIHSLWGTYAAHLRNMMKGVVENFEKKLVVEGVGYRPELSGQDLVLNVGFSHPVRVPPVQGIAVSVEKNVITVKGSDKEKVGEFCARVRNIRKPEPYKGKGIRYDGEVVRRKQGKKTT